jgi:hypothetical protein
MVQKIHGWLIFLSEKFLFFLIIKFKKVGVKFVISWAKKVVDLSLFLTCFSLLGSMVILCIEMKKVKKEEMEGK